MELTDDHRVQLACAALQAIISADPKLVKDNPERVANEAVRVSTIMARRLKDDLDTELATGSGSWRAGAALKGVPPLKATTSPPAP
jgi:hypothetical protein